MIFILSFTFTKAQDSYVEEVTVDTVEIKSNSSRKIDSIIMSGYATDNVLYPKKFKENFRKKYQTEEFNYNTTKPRISLWQKLLAKIQEWLRSVFGEVDGTKTLDYTGMFLKILAFLLVGFLLYILISYIIQKMAIFSLARNRRKLIFMLKKSRKIFMKLISLKKF